VGQYAPAAKGLQRFGSVAAASVPRRDDSGITFMANSTRDLDDNTVGVPQNSRVVGPAFVPDGTESTVAGGVGFTRITDRNGTKYFHYDSTTA